MIDPSKLNQLMQQAQAMQARMQDELKNKTVSGVAGGGLVRVQMNGMLEVQSVKIDKAAIDPNDATLLEDLVKAAVSAAVQSAEQLRASHAASLAHGMGLSA